MEKGTAMSGIYRTALENSVNKACRNKTWCGILSDTLQKLDSGFFDKKFVDIIFQKTEMESLSIYDAYAFIHVWKWIGNAEIVMASIELGEFPKKDKYIDENNKSLQLLDGKFAGVFYGGTQDEDGYVEVKTPIILNMKNLTTGKWVEKKVKGYFPLEVGFTSPEKTMINLSESGSGRLARWCYESDKIYLMQRIRYNIAS